MIVRFQWENQVWVIIAVAVIIYFLYYAVQIAYVVHVHGSVIEEYRPSLAEQLFERASEWNIMREINLVLPLADDFDWVIKK